MSRLKEITMRMSMRWFGIMLILLALPLTATAQVKAPPQGKINLEPAVSYEKSIELPYRGFSEDEVKVIDEVSDWQAVNDPDYRIFYVHPGDYREAGRITLTASGKEGRPRWLIYRDPENPKDTTTHPYHMDKDRQVLIDHLELDGASHWVVDRLRWHRMTRVVNGLHACCQQRDFQHAGRFDPDRAGPAARAGHGDSGQRPVRHAADLYRRRGQFHTRGQLCRLGERD